VAAIPGSAFYYDGRTGPGRGLVRFAFCKRTDTLRTAARRLHDT
jgi:aspartate/methionine/tyrosine aminotransferase